MILILIKKILIKFFKLDDITDLLKESKKTQRKEDTKYWRDRIEDFEIRLNRKHQLEIQDYLSKIFLLEDDLKNLKNRERKLNDKEYVVKTISKENTLMAVRLSSKIGEFIDTVMGITGEFNGLKDDAETHQKKIEGKKDE